MRNNALNNLFIKAITGRRDEAEEEIAATFKNGRTINYTTEIFSLLVTDKDVLTIISAETGEIYFDRSDNYLALPEHYN